MSDFSTPRPSGPAPSPAPCAMRWSTHPSRPCSPCRLLRTTAAPLRAGDNTVTWSGRRGAAVSFGVRRGSGWLESKPLSVVACVAAHRLDEGGLGHGVLDAETAVDLAAAPELMPTLLVAAAMVDLHDPSGRVRSVRPLLVVGEEECLLHGLGRDLVRRPVVVDGLDREAAVRRVQGVDPHRVSFVCALASCHRLGHLFSYKGGNRSTRSAVLTCSRTAERVVTKSPVPRSPQSVPRGESRF